MTGTIRAMRHKSNLLLYLIILLGVFVWSAIRPHDYFTWFLEVLPALLGIGILAATYRRFEFTGLVYFLVTAHAIILMIGGHYTYAEVPLFNWVRDHFGLVRNDYDRLGHFFQGFVPAIITREVLLRTTSLKKGKMVTFLTVCVCMAFSALYELFEWRVAVATGSAADAFLGSQGDVWDTQEDMAMCLVGSIVSVLTLSRFHNRLLSDKLTTYKTESA
jgi:putative membrane protein